jgi:hypothetical protein
MECAIREIINLRVDSRPELFITPVVLDISHSSKHFFLNRCVKLRSDGLPECFDIVSMLSKVQAGNKTCR